MPTWIVYALDPEAWWSFLGGEHTDLPGKEHAWMPQGEVKGALASSPGFALWVLFIIKV